MFRICINKIRIKNISTDLFAAIASILLMNLKIMKRINPKELPSVLTEETINILALMANEVPQSQEWHEIFDLLSPSSLRLVMDKKIEIQDQQEKAKKDSMTEEAKKEEEEQRKRFYENFDPLGFYGNMGEPETPRQSKDKYGVWPPGYDEKGNKM